MRVVTVGGSKVTLSEIVCMTVVVNTSANTVSVGVGEHAIVT